LAATSTWTASRRALGVASSAETATEATRAPSRDCATALDIYQYAAVFDLDTVGLFVGGLHVLFALKHDESVTALSLLGWRVGGLSNVFDDADALNRTVAAEFALEVIRSDAIRQARHEERFESVTLDFGIFGGFVILDSFGKQVLLFLLLFELLAIALLQPAVGGHIAVVVFVFPQRLEVLAHATNLGRAALLRRVVGRLNPSQRRPRGEQVQQHRGE
jgi:hypothetical protein